MPFWDGGKQCPTCACAIIFVLVLIAIVQLNRWRRARARARAAAQAAQDEQARAAAEQAIALRDDSGDRITSPALSQGEIMKPPMVGPPLNYGLNLPEASLHARYDERGLMPLPRGGLSCANKRWYDSIYNGGAETVLDPEPGLSKADVRSLWEEDAIVRRREIRAPEAAPQPPVWRNMFV